MVVSISSDVTAEFIEGCFSVSSPPRWFLPDLYLSLGPYGSMQEHESHTAEMTGAFSHWWNNSDEMCFSNTDLRLESLWFHVPEANVPDPSELEDWLEVPEQSGSLRLTSKRNFELKPTCLRWVGRDGEFLFCVQDSALGKAMDKMRLGVGTDIDLLFAKNELCGWILKNPSRYIVDAWDQSVPTSSSGIGPSPLYKYVKVVNLPNVERMENQDPQMLQELRELYAQMNHLPKDRFCSVLQGSIAHLVDWFWDEQPSV